MIPETQMTINKAQAINSFLENIEQLSGLPFISDSEINSLFGEEVAAALARLNHYARERQICLCCEGRCCKIAHCELYAPQFERCPIYDFRPVVCRLHFCQQFQTTGSSLVKELGDIFFESLTAADSYGSAKVRMFDNPPLSICCSDFVEAVTPWVDAVQEGSLNPKRAVELIQCEMEKFKSTDIYSVKSTETHV